MMSAAGQLKRGEHDREAIRSEKNVRTSVLIRPSPALSLRAVHRAVGWTRTFRVED